VYEYAYTPSAAVSNSLADVGLDRRAETEHVVERMIVAGWPSPEDFAEGASTEKAGEEWAAILVGLAVKYLKSIVLRVDVLVALGPCARDDLARALDLAEWEPA
jgi:hypothetical protein